MFQKNLCCLPFQFTLTRPCQMFIICQLIMFLNPGGGSHKPDKQADKQIDKEQRLLRDKHRKPFTFLLRVLVDLKVDESRYPRTNPRFGTSGTLDCHPLKHPLVAAQQSPSAQHAPSSLPGCPAHLHPLLLLLLPHLHLPPPPCGHHGHHPPPAQGPAPPGQPPAPLPPPLLTVRLLLPPPP